MNSPSPRIIVALAFGTLLSALPARAQDSIPSSFQRGQWGANVAVTGLTFAGVDVLRFTSPTRAWVFSVNGAVLRDKESGSYPIPSQSNQNVDLGLQRRFIRPLASHASVYLSPGIHGGWGHMCVNPVPGVTQCSSSWDLGITAEVGGEYMIWRHFGVGARYSALVSYYRASILGGSVWNLSGNIGSAGVFAALLF
jgi:hypothetical protein